jgi:hypothetical protein
LAEFGDWEILTNCRKSFSGTPIFSIRA